MPLAVSAYPRPWDFARVDLTVPVGATVAEIVAAAQPEPALWRHTEVLIGDGRVPPEFWGRVRPRLGAVVTVNTVPGDSGSLRVGLSIGIVLAAAFLPPPFNVMAGVGGALGLALLLPPEQEKVSKTSNTVDSPSYSLGASRNRFNPGGAVPQLFGSFRFAPPKAGEYPETVGGDQFLRLLLVLSGGLVTDPEITIGETALDQFSDVETEFKRGWHPSILTDRGGWSAASGAFPTGSAFGDRWTVSAVGTVDGQVFAVGDTIIRNHNSVENQVSGWDRNHDQPHRLFPSDVYADGFSAALPPFESVVRTTQVNADEIAVTFAAPAMIQYNSKGRKETASVKFRIEQSAHDADAWSEVGVYTVRGKKAAAFFWGKRWTVDRAAAPNGLFDVRITRLTEENPTNDNQYLADLSWTQIDTITTEDPLGGNVGFSTLALRILATGQLFGTLKQLFCLCTSIERAWNVDDQAWEWRATRLPGSHFRHVLQQPLRADGALSDSRLDLDQLAAWSEADIAAGRQFNAYVDYGTTEHRILTDVARAGFASLTTARGTRHGVVIDEPKPAAVRLFSPRNSSNYRLQIVYPDVAHGYRVTFADAEQGYGIDEFIVYDDGHDQATAQVIEDREYIGLTSRRANWLQARRDIAEARLRREIHKSDTAIQSIACERGDLVKLQHYAIAVGQAAGRVRGIA